MGLIAATGRSKNIDTEVAVQAAIEVAKHKLDGQKPDLSIVFASVRFDQQKIVDTMVEQLPGTKIVGCSDAGEITEEGPDKKSIVVMLLSAPQLKIYTAIGGNIADNAIEAGKKIAQKIYDQAGGVPKVFFMLPDGLAGNGAEIVQGVQAIFGEHYRFVGGSAGDDFLFKKTYQYYQNEVHSGKVVGVGIDGDVHFGIGIRHGWKPLGIPKKVTKSHGNIVEKIDEKPAVSIYEEYFGKEKSEILHKEPLARLAITYPLGMRVEGSDEFLIRDPITADDKGAITCAAAVPEGAEIQIMLGGRKEAIEASKLAASQAMAELGRHIPQAVLNFNCIARERILGLHSGEEIKAMLEVIGPGTPFLGFYTYGEQAPIGEKMTTCHTSFHNETTVLLVLGQ